MTLSNIISESNTTGESPQAKPSIEITISIPKGVITADDAAVFRDVIHECLRQRIAEGFSTENDDAHVNGELAAAAFCYAAHAATPDDVRQALTSPPQEWPWTRQWWKPTTPERDLIKSISLSIAEIQRSRRAITGKVGA
jgi:hypothetical protein